MTVRVTFFWQQKKVTKENCARYEPSGFVRRAIAAVIHDGRCYALNIAVHGVTTIDARHLDLHFGRKRGDVGDKNFTVDVDSRRDKKSDGALVPALRAVCDACGDDFPRNAQRHAVAAVGHACICRGHFFGVVRRESV